MPLMGNQPALGGVRCGGQTVGEGGAVVWLRSYSGTWCGGDGGRGGGIIEGCWGIGVAWRNETRGSYSRSCLGLAAHRHRLSVWSLCRYYCGADGITKLYQVTRSAREYNVLIPQLTRFPRYCSPRCSRWPATVAPAEQVVFSMHTSRNSPESEIRNPTHPAPPMVTALVATQSIRSL